MPGTTVHPLIIFVEGWTCFADIYEPMIEHFVSHGFIVVMPLTNDLSPLPYAATNWDLHKEQACALLPSHPRPFCCAIFVYTRCCLRTLLLCVFVPSFRTIACAGAWCASAD